MPHNIYSSYFPYSNPYYGSTNFNYIPSSKKIFADQYAFRSANTLGNLQEAAVYVGVAAVVTGLSNQSKKKQKSDNGENSSSGTREVEYNDTKNTNRNTGNSASNYEMSRAYYNTQNTSYSGPKKITQEEAYEMDGASAIINQREADRTRAKKTHNYTFSHRTVDTKIKSDVIAIFDKHDYDEKKDAYDKERNEMIETEDQYLSARVHGEDSEIASTWTRYSKEFSEYESADKGLEKAAQDVTTDLKAKLAELENLVENRLNQYDEVLKRLEDNPDDEDLIQKRDELHEAISQDKANIAYVKDGLKEVLGDTNIDDDDKKIDPNSDLLDFETFNQGVQSEKGKLTYTPTVSHQSIRAAIPQMEGITGKNDSNIAKLQADIETFNASPTRSNRKNLEKTASRLNDALENEYQNLQKDFAEQQRAVNDLLNELNSNNENLNNDRLLAEANLLNNMYAQIIAYQNIMTALQLYMNIQKDAEKVRLLDLEKAAQKS